MVYCEYTLYSLFWLKKASVPQDKRCHRGEKIVRKAFKIHKNTQYSRVDNICFAVGSYRRQTFYDPGGKP